MKNKSAGITRQKSHAVQDGRVRVVVVSNYMTAAEAIDYAQAERCYEPVFHVVRYGRKVKVGVGRLEAKGETAPRSFVKRANPADVLTMEQMRCVEQEMRKREHGGWRRGAVSGEH